MKAALLLLTSLVIPGCIEETRRSRVLDTLQGDSREEDTSISPDTAAPEDTVTPPDTNEPETRPDSSEPDTADTADTVDAADTASPEDTTSPTDTDIVQLACLPTGCTEPGTGCEVLNGFCWSQGCVAEGDLNPTDPCARCGDSLGTTNQWTPVADDTPCDDGVACTAEDVCRQGVCQGRSTCASSLACVSARCDPETKACVEDIAPETCVFDGVCFAKDEYTPDACGACRPGTSQRVPVPGDVYEPNNEEVFATGLTYAPDSDGVDANEQGWQLVPGTSLSPASDIDFFAWSFELDAVTRARPIGRVRNPGGEELQLCVYASCESELNQPRPTTAVECGGGPTAILGTWIGCCQSSAQELITAGPSKVTCSRVQTGVTTIEAVVVVKRAPGPSASACYPYSLEVGAH